MYLNYCICATTTYGLYKICQMKRLIGEVYKCASYTSKVPFTGKMTTAIMKRK